MKSKLFFTLCMGIIIIAACRKDTPGVTPASTKNNNQPQAAYRLPNSMADSVSSKFIPMSVANQMINSYLSSINYVQNDTDVRSFSVNADSLRAFLADNSIKNIKLVLAHSINYVNAGYFGVPAGYQSYALTLIIAAYDEDGNYVYYNGNNVLDHAVPCPFTCPPGAAGNNLLE